MAVSRASMAVSSLQAAACCAPRIALAALVLLPLAACAGSPMRVESRYDDPDQKPSFTQSDANLAWRHRADRN